MVQERPPWRGWGNPQRGKDVFLRIWREVFSVHLCSSENKFYFFQIQEEYSGIEGLRNFCEESCPSGKNIS